MPLATLPPAELQLVCVQGRSTAGCRSGTQQTQRGSHFKYTCGTDTSNICSHLDHCIIVHSTATYTGKHRHATFNTFTSEVTTCSTCFCFINWVCCPQTVYTNFVRTSKQSTFLLSKVNRLTIVMEFLWRQQKNVTTIVITNNFEGLVPWPLGF